MPDSYVVRGIYVIFALGSAAVLFARGIAHWSNCGAWPVRSGGLVLLCLGVGGVWDQFGAGPGLKALAAVAVSTALIIWNDTVCEWKEEQLAAEERREAERRVPPPRDDG
jgi:hypothetical protein